MFDWLFPWRNIERQLHEIQDQINEGNQRIMADITALTAAVDQVQTDVGEAVTELRRLGDIIRAGGNVSQADLDALTEKLTGAGAALDDAVAEDETPPA